MTNKPIICQNFYFENFDQIMFPQSYKPLFLLQYLKKEAFIFLKKNTQREKEAFSGFMAKKT